VARLHEALLRVARAELARRAGQLRISGPELDDLAFQAAADAVVAKVGQFRGESRFTTWAYRFVILEVSAKVGRHFWGQPHVPMDTGDWDQLPDRLGLGPRPQDRPGHRRTDTCQIAVEPGITVTAARTSSRDIRRHKASNYPSQPGVYALPCDDQL
jgi:hypothetical protein